MIFWKPEEGEHEICIVPYMIRENSIFRQTLNFNYCFSEEALREGRAWPYKLSLLIHMEKQEWSICPHTIQQQCPKCRIDAGGRVKRAVYNIFCFDTEEEKAKGVQIWFAPHSSIEDVLAELHVDKRTGKKRFYTIPEEGWNVYFERRGKGLDTEYRQVSIVERREEDQFSEEEYDQLYDQAWDLDEIFRREVFRP
jgi:hypothetical protein